MSKFPRDSGDFCLLDRSVVESLNQLPEKNRFVRGLRAWYGGRQIGVPYNRPSRAAGETRYPIGKLLNLAFDGIVSFSLLPFRLHFLAWLRIFHFCDARSAVFPGSPHHRLSRSSVTPLMKCPGFTSLMLVVLLLSGLQLLSIGVLGEYLGRMYLEVKNRPEYVLAHFAPSMYGEQAATANSRSVILMSAVRMALGFAVAILFAVLLVRNVDLAEALGSALKIGPKILAAAMLLVLLGYLVRAWRWLLMLGGAGVSATYWQAAPIFFASFALNNVLPLRVGDIYRCWSATILQHATLTKAIASLLTERVLDLMSLAGLLGFLSLVFPRANLLSLWWPLALRTNRGACITHRVYFFSAAHLAIYRGRSFLPPDPSGPVAKVALWIRNLADAIDGTLSKGSRLKVIRSRLSPGPLSSALSS